MNEHTKPTIDADDGPLDRSTVRKGWLIYLAVMLGFYVLIKVFGDQAPPAQPTEQARSQASHTGKATH